MTGVWDWTGLVQEKTGARAFVKADSAPYSQLFGDLASKLWP